MTNSRKLIIDPNYKPFPVNEGDEIFRNGYFHFNISKILELIQAGELVVETERIDVKKWFENHFQRRINEEHLPTVDITNSVVQAEIRPGMYEIIDGNHRIEKARREGVEWVPSYKLKGEQLVPFFRDADRYNAFVNYWNSKLR
nr:hypothetical protein [uncultured Bacillus sp.]